MFKKGDIVRCIKSNKINRNQFKLVLNSLHVIKYIGTDHAIRLVSNLFSSNNESLLYDDHRFIKVEACDITKEEKFRYITYKLKGEITI